MMKKVLPVAVAALVLSAGAALAEPLMSIAEGAGPDIDNHRPANLTDTDMASVTGRGACTRGVEAFGKLGVVLGHLTLNHNLVFGGHLMIGLAPAICV